MAATRRAEGNRDGPPPLVRRDRGRGAQAGAHHLGKVVSGQPYDEAKAFDSTPAATARRLKNLHHQAHSLNLKLVPA